MALADFGALGTAVEAVHAVLRGGALRRPTLAWADPACIPDGPVSRFVPDPESGRKLIEASCTNRIAGLNRMNASVRSILHNPQIASSRGGVVVVAVVVVVGLARVALAVVASDVGRVALPGFRSGSYRCFADGTGMRRQSR